MSDDHVTTIGGVDQLRGREVVMLAVADDLGDLAEQRQRPYVVRGEILGFVGQNDSHRTATYNRTARLCCAELMSELSPPDALRTLTGFTFAQLQVSFSEDLEKEYR